MSRYVDKVLQPGETVAFVSNVHWIIYLPAIFFFVVAAVVVGMATISQEVNIGYGAAGLAFALGLLGAVRAWFARWTTEIAVTNRRIIYKRGFIRRRTIEMNMDKVESVDVDQSILGRLLNYGDITVRGTGTGIEPLRTIDSPLEFRNSVIAR